MAILSQVFSELMRDERWGMRDWTAPPIRRLCIVQVQKMPVLIPHLASPIPHRFGALQESRRTQSDTLRVRAEPCGVAQITGMINNERQHQPPQRSKRGAR